MPCLTLVVTPCDSVVGHDYVVGPWLGSVVECDYVDGSVVGHDYMTGSVLGSVVERDYMVGSMVGFRGWVWLSRWLHGWV